MAVIRLPVLVGNHADDFVALQLRLKAAAHAAVGTSLYFAVLGLTHFLHRFFNQRSGRTGLNTGSAGNAFGCEEIGAAWRDFRSEAAAVDGQSERALNLFAGADAARANNAFRRLELEVRIGFVLGLVLIVVRPVHAVADFA